MVTTKDPDLAEKVRKLRVHGAKVKYFHEMIGGNFRLHELQAAFLRVKLQHLDQALQKRREKAVQLTQQLQNLWKGLFPTDQCLCEGERLNPKSHPDGAVLLPFSCQKGDGGHTWNQFVIRVVGGKKRDGLRNWLSQKGIQTEVYYPKSMHEQKCLANTQGEFPTAEKLTQEVLALPLAGNFSLPLSP